MGLNKHKKILRRSIILSICFHLFGLFFFQRYSLWFSSPSAIPKPGGGWVSSMEKREKNQILKESFQALAKLPEERMPVQEIAEAPEIRVPIPLSLEQLQASSLATLPFPEPRLLVADNGDLFHLPEEKPLNLFEHLPKELILSTPQLIQTKPPLPSPKPIPTETSVSAAPMPDFPKQAPPAAISSSPPSLPIAASFTPLIQVTPQVLPSQWPKIPSLAELHTVSHSDVFDLEIHFAPKEEGEGYIFALTLIPKDDLQILPLKQNYYFLIDRSNSIQRERLQMTKNAVRKALEELNVNDSFNVFVFDSTVEKSSPLSLSPSRKSFEKVDDFLAKIELGSFFSQSDLFKPLFLTIPAIESDDELNTVILMTDGENLGKKGEMVLEDWTQYNQGKVSLFALGLETDGHLETLQKLTAFNKGKVYSATTKRGLKRKLLKLMKSIKNPIAKHLKYRAIPQAPDTQIELFGNHKVPHLYLGEPYVILGETNQLDDFILFIQARSKGEWIHIKKTVSFLNAKKGGVAFKNDWELQKSLR